MNYDNLHELINRYESKLEQLYGAENDELFKWRAMYVWRQEWFKPEDAFASFIDRFNAARREFHLFIDNSRMHPSSGVVKLWEKEPETVEHLFYDILFADTSGSALIAQDHMDTFVDEYEALRQKYFPANWSFKQDRHSASVYLAMNDPSFNFVYKSNEAATMAKYVDFGFSIGAGATFNLANYYRLCDEIVSALKEHPSLLDKHFSRLKDGYYIDKSLHLLAFDVIYCCRTYGYYKGLTAASGKTVKKAVKAAPTAEELARMEQARLDKIEALEQEIEALEQSCDACEDISLIGVQVTLDEFGKGTVIGTVIGQSSSKITVQFADCQKTFILDKQYGRRPKFENDDEIVSLYTDYNRVQVQIRKLKSQLAALEK